MDKTHALRNVGLLLDIEVIWKILIRNTYRYTNYRKSKGTFRNLVYANAVSFS